MNEILAKIRELRKLADRTDSKKEDLAYRMQIRELERQLGAEIDKKIEAFPDNVRIHIKVDKVVDYDTSDFKCWVSQWIEDNEDYDVDLNEEFKDYFDENFYSDEFIYSDDYDFKVEK